MNVYRGRSKSFTTCRSLLSTHRSSGRLNSHSSMRTLTHAHFHQYDSSDRNNQGRPPPTAVKQIPSILKPEGPIEGVEFLGGGSYIASFRPARGSEGAL